MRFLYKRSAFVFVVHFVGVSWGLFPSNLYPFGRNSDDSRLPNEDDVNSPETTVPPFTFYGTTQKKLYVNENGFISFGRKTKDATLTQFPEKGRGYIVAPYWADVYTPRGGEIWYRLTTDKSITSKATKGVIRAFPEYKGFEAHWTFIVTWSNVAFFGASTQNNDTRNTFQALLTTDGLMSFVAYVYANLSWTTGTLNGGNSDGLEGFEAQVGFSFGERYYVLPGSGTQAVLNLAHTSNCGQPGVWFFRVDDYRKINEVRCDTKGVVGILPSKRPLQSGDNIVIKGLCYRPTSGVSCDFGEAGTGTGYYFSDTKAFCTVPLLTSNKQVSLRIKFNDETNLQLAQTLKLEPIDFSNSHIKRLKPTAWVIGNHVNITWDPRKLADQSVIVETITFTESNDVRRNRPITTFALQQPNTGQAEFKIPEFKAWSNTNAIESISPVSFVRVRGKLGRVYNNHAPKQWIWSDLYPLTNRRMANKSCLRWHARETQDYSNKGDGIASAPCPKTLGQLIADVGRFTSYEMCNGHFTTLCSMYESTAKVCYRTVLPSHNGGVYKCCFDNQHKLIPGSLSGGNVLANLPRDDATLYQHFFKDVQPYLECCVFSDNCAKFHELRLSAKQSSYSPPRMGASFGDPHIITFDGVDYTFNGFGEYTVLEVGNMQFTLQGRMQPLREQSIKSPATAFTAFAMQQKGGSKIQVQQKDENAIEILIDGVLTPIYPSDQIEFPGVFIRYMPRGNLSRTILTFSSGITVYVENAAVLQMAISLPPIFKGTTRGLLGYWDDTSYKEFLLPDNTFLSTVSSMPDVHHRFGQKWATHQNESLFTYSPDKTHIDYFDESYVPTFMDSHDSIIATMNKSLQRRAVQTCGQSDQCMFDIGVTGRLDIGASTKEFQEWLLGIREGLRYKGCETTVTLQQGVVQRITTDEVTTYRLRCNSGFVLDGKDTVTCVRGVWDASIPSCKNVTSASKVSCQSLDVSLPNGIVHEQGFSPGDRYLFKCHQGFLLIGEREIECGENGLWSGSVPICETRNCSKVFIDNGFVNVQSELQLVITCNEGFELIGPGVIGCQPDGTFNETPPTCLKVDQRKAPQATNVLPVIIIGVVVIVIAVIVILVTVYLVRKHRKRKTKRASKQMHGEQKRTAV